MSARVLVVDNEWWDFTEFLSFNLTVSAFKVVIAANGLDALVIAQRFLANVAA